MKTIVYKSYGPPDVLQIGEEEKPTAGNNRGLSNDNHFNVLEAIEFPEVPLIKIEEFLELLK